jgi:hypothetical protein
MLFSTISPFVPFGICLFLYVSRDDFFPPILLRSSSFAVNGTPFFSFLNWFKYWSKLSFLSLFVNTKEVALVNPSVGKLYCFKYEADGGQTSKEEGKVFGIECDGFRNG